MIMVRSGERFKDANLLIPSQKITRAYRRPSADYSCSFFAPSRIRVRHKHPRLPLPRWGGFGQERGDTSAAVFGGTGEGVDAGGVGERLGKRQVPDLGQHLFGERNRRGARLACKLGGELIYGLIERASGNGAGDEADLGCFSGGKEPSPEEQIPGRRLANLSQHEYRHNGGDEPDANLRKAEPSVIGDDREVTDGSEPAP